MRADSSGIHIQKAELGALLAFCGDTSGSNVVKFMVGNAGKMAAVASDGKRCVEAKSAVDVDGALTGEWAIDRNYMETCRRILDDGETEALIKTTEKGIKGVHVIGIESGDVRRRVDAPSDIASTQLTFDAVRRLIAAAVQDEGTWFALQPAHLKDLNEIYRATKCPVSLSSGKEPTDPVAFMATCENATWSGVIMPIPVTGFGDEARDKADGDDDSGPGASDADEFKLTPETTAGRKKKPKATAPTKKKARKKAAKKS
jgi:hypothetical protein